MSLAKLIALILFAITGVGIALYLVGYTVNIFSALTNSGGSELVVPSADPISVLKGLCETPYGKYIIIGSIALVVIICVIAIIKTLSTQKTDDRNFVVSEKGTYGTANLMSEKEAATVKNSEEKNILSVKSKLDDSDTGVILGKFPDGSVCLRNIYPKGNNHIFVNGTPGSGKSYSFARPYLAQCIRRRESFVVTDPSGELFNSIAAYAKHENYELRVFNLVEPEHSDSWNFIEDVGQNQLYAQICANTIIDNTSDGKMDKFWDPTEQNLLKALILYVTSDSYKGEKNFGSVYTLLSDKDFVKDTLPKLKELPSDHPAKMPISIFSQQTEKVQADCIGGLAIRLQIFQAKVLRDMVSCTGIDLLAPAQKPCAYFIILPEQHSTFELLSSLFFSMMFIKLDDFGHECNNNDFPVHINFVLDELPAIGRIPGLGGKIATLRKYGVNMIPIVQIISQLDNRYSPEEREEIITSCDTQICLGTSNQKDAEMLSELSGVMTVEVNSTSESFEGLTGGGTRTTSSVGKRAVLTPDEIRRLPLNEAIILLRGQQPLKLTKFGFHEHPASKIVEDLKPLTARNYSPTYHYEEHSIPETEPPKPHTPEPPKVQVPTPPAKPEPKAPNQRQAEAFNPLNFK